MLYFIAKAFTLLNFSCSLESINEEKFEVLKRLGLEKKLTKLAVSNEGRNKKTQEYFSTLNKDLLNKLYQIYKLDFEFFGYSVDEY